MKRIIGILFLIAAFNHIYGNDVLLPTFNHEMARINKLREKLYELCFPLLQTPSNMARDLSESIEAIPKDFKGSILDAVFFVEKEHVRYQRCLAPFNTIYRSYKVDFGKNEKLDGIAKKYSKQIKKSFPLLEEMMALVIGGLKPWTTGKSGDLPKLPSLMQKSASEREKLKKIIDNCKNSTTIFKDKFSNLKQQRPRSIPTEPNSEQFSGDLQDKIGPLKRLLPTFNDEMAHIKKLQERLYKLTMPLLETPPFMEKDLSKSIVAIPHDFKNSIHEAVLFVELEHRRYQLCSAPFETIYRDYKNKFGQNEKLDGIAKKYSKRIEESFPLLEEMMALVTDELKLWTTGKSGGLAELPSLMKQSASEREKLNEIIKNCKNGAKISKDKFSNLKQQRPKNIPAQPSSEEFLKVLKAKVGSLDGKK